jgi:ABC-2 type transport system permease protein
MNALANHFSFEFKTGLRNPSLLLLHYLFPLAFYVLMGLVMTQINSLFKASMVPAMVIFTALAGTVLGLPSPLVEAREAGIFRSFKINGVPAPAILCLPALASMIHVLIAGMLIALTGPLLFGGAAPANPLAFALITMAVAFTLAGFGALIGVVSANSRATVLWSQLIFLPSMLLGGLMVPLDVLPASVRPVASLLPTAHAMQAYMGLAYGQPTVIAPWLALGVLCASGILAFGLAIYLFNWDARNQARRGHPVLALLALVPYIVAILLTRAA